MSHNSDYRDNYRTFQRETFWTIPRAFFLGLLALVALYGIGFVATGGDYAIYKFWAPKMENAQREVFESTQGYVEGKIEYLTRLRIQYGAAEGAQKDGLRTMILMEASSIDNSKLPYDLRTFINDLNTPKG